MRVKNLRLKSSICSVLAVAALSGVATGQEVMLLEEIVVTAQKRSESLQNVPIAISAYTDETRDVIGIKTVEDVAAFTPGMNFSSLDRMSIRGIGRLTNGLGSDPGIATYSDGFYTASLSEVGKSPMFIERVEVLRGPQGTLYGRNAIGGAVNIIAKRPSAEEFRGEVRASVGNYSSTTLEGAIDGPITDSMRFRIAGQQARQRDGFFENTVGEDRYTVDRSMIEAQFEMDITENINWWIKYQTSRWSDENADGSLNNVALDPYAASAGAFPGGLVPNADFFTTAAFNGGVAVTRASVSDPYRINENQAGRYSIRDNHIVATNLTIDFDAVTLKYIGGWQQYDFASTVDADGTPLTGPYDGFLFFGAFPNSVPVYPHYVSDYGDIMQYSSNELNLQSNGDDAVSWILGLYQFNERRRNPVSLSAPLQTEISGLNTWLTEGGRFYYSYGDLQSESLAAFGQTDIKFGDAWNLTLGLRYSQDKKEGFEENWLVLFLPATGLAGGTGTSAQILAASPGQRTLPEEKWDAITGKVGLQWEVTDGLGLYTSYNRGYKSGGFNLGTVIATPTVKEETVDAFEVGVKSNPVDQLQVNGSVFFYKYNDAQVPFEAFRNGVTAIDFKNVDSESLGFELETIFAPIDSLQFMVNYSYLKAEITEGCCYYNSSDLQALQPGAAPVAVDTAGNRLQDLEGNTMPQSPEHKVAFNTNYTLNFAMGNLTFSGTYTWQDETSYTIFDDPRAVAPSFGRADFRALWNDTDDRYTLIAYIRNAFDDEGYNAASVGAESFGSVRTRNLLPPRTFGGEVQVRF